MNIIPKDFQIKLDPDHPRLPMADLCKILDALVAPENKFPVVYQSGILGAGGKTYLHITAQNNVKQWNLAFQVREDVITNCMACVTPSGKEWNTDTDDAGKTPAIVWPLLKWQLLTKLLLGKPKERRISLKKLYRVCIESEPGNEDWRSFSRMYDKGLGKKGLGYPAVLETGVDFMEESDALAAAEKSRAYVADLLLKEQDKKNKDKKK